MPCGRAWALDYVANGVDSWIVRLELFVGLYESALADLHTRLVSGRVRVGLATDGDENMIENFFLCAAVLRFQGGADAGAFVFHCLDGCV